MQHVSATVAHERESYKFMCRSRFASKIDRAPLKAGMATAHPSAALDLTKRRPDNGDAPTTRFQVLQVKKPKRFVMPTQNGPKVQVIPKVKDLTESTAVPLPDIVVQKLGDATIVVGVDIETADWVDKKQPITKEPNGFFHFCHPENASQKIVQIGWALGEVREEAPLMECGEHLVRPEGFAVSDKALAFHGITQKMALARGRPLRDVLTDFMDMVDRATDMGARIIVHHLGFEARIIEQQLCDAGLECRKAQWVRFANKGFCTMDPDVGAWVQRCRGRDVALEEKSAPVLSLKTATSLLLPKSDLIDTLISNSHTAGADAQLHRLVYIAMRSLASEC